MNKLYLVLVGLLLTACAEYPGAKTNCWTPEGKAQPAMSFMATKGTAQPSYFGSTGGCDFVPLD